ncbi:uncharacterized protein N7482_007533 [Penicillium canariense]|uniref:SUZ domain-containing protein n=1 Tax=Penicillium canariense TaxID=189055 RepID=A0A9W9HWY3_9EURO|nr:uncharacterized protein N7482_007533 [Penicillium canariense]KAJ5160529.1 hypothetical protein N7482_007533 [Penicillium canariense]
MASPRTTTGDAHFYFTKVAAMSAPSNPQSLAASDENGSAPPVDITSCAELLETGASVPGPHNLNTIKRQIPPGDPDVDDLTKAVQEVDVTLRKVREGSGSSMDGQDNGLLKRENSFEDDRTHLSTSSTKMTNFDSKSLASVTTFAMDEKDSVRPDDSASVQAIDEEESLSGAASGAPNSVTGSEAGGRAFRDHFRDHFRDNNAPRPRGVLLCLALFSTVATREGLLLFLQIRLRTISPENPPNAQSIHPFPLEPDEKLVTAMKNIKDRLMILGIEEKIRYFIEFSSEQSLELPPDNSFGRLLAHRLGDYYHLTHFVDNNVTSVRLHRTPFSRLPTPLSDLYPATNEPLASIPAMKIMRRTDGEQPSAEGSVATSSSVPSKAASESGDVGHDGDRTGSTGPMSAKDRMAMTREEREAKYQEVRERIFRDFPESAKSEASADSNLNMSRSSSTSGRKKNQRQRTPHDDGFEARSQFNPYYPGLQYNNNGSPAYNAAGGMAPTLIKFRTWLGPNNAMYPGQMGMNNVPQYPMAMSPQMASSGSWQGGNMPQQSPFSGYSSMNQPGLLGQQPSTKSSPAMNNFPTPHSPQFQQTHNWNSGPFPGNFQPSPHQRNQPPVPWANYPAQSMTSNIAAYPYTQYPGQHLNLGLQNPGNPGMAGNFPGSHFNPQTRSFIPGDAGMQRHPSKGAQQQMQPYGNRPPNTTQPNWLSRFPESIPNQTVDHSPAANASRIPNTSTQTSIAKWGIPSHLPPKPPPSEVPSDFELKHRTGLPTPAAARNGISGIKNGPLVVSGGTFPSKTD